MQETFAFVTLFLMTDGIESAFAIKSVDPYI